MEKSLIDRGRFSIWSSELLKHVKELFAGRELLREALRGMFHRFSFLIFQAHPSPGWLVGFCSVCGLFFVYFSLQGHCRSGSHIFFLQ